MVTKTMLVRSATPRPKQKWREKLISSHLAPRRSPVLIPPPIFSDPELKTLACVFFGPALGLHPKTDDGELEASKDLA